MDSPQARMPEPPLVPYLTVSNGDAALDFYQRAFGATVLSREYMPNTTKIMHAAFLVNGALLMLSDDFPEMGDGSCRSPEALGGSPVTLHLTISDVDTPFNAAVAAGATVLMPLADQFWGSRYGTLRDPFGHTWSLGTPMKPMTDAERTAAMEAAFASAPA